MVRGSFGGVCLSLEAPRCRSFQPRMNHARELRSEEEIGNRVHLVPPIWTSGQETWTIRRHPSMFPDIYYVRCDEFCGRGGSNEVASDRFQRRDGVGDAAVDGKGRGSLERE